MAYLHVVLDMYDYEEILKVTKKEFRDGSFIFLNLHMEMGAIAGYKDIQVKPGVRIKQQLCPNLELHFAILSFIQNYDGLYLADSTLLHEQVARKIKMVLDAAKSGQQQIILWHRNSGESLCAFFYMVSLLKPIVSRGSILEGVNLNREIKRLIYSKSFIDKKEEQRIVENCSKLIQQGKDHYIDLEQSRLVFENSDMRIIHSPYQTPISTDFSYYDPFILSYFKKHPVKTKNVIKQIQSDIGGEQFLWTNFLIFRLCHLRDQGYFDVVSTPPVLDITQPTIYDECWQLQQEKCTRNDDFAYDELKILLYNDPAGFETEQYIDHLLHTIPLSEQSKKFLFRELEHAKNKNRIVISLLVRLSEFLTQEERKQLLLSYSTSGA